MTQKYYQKQKIIHLSNYNSEHFGVWCRVWQIPTREINKILSTEMDVLRRPARKSRMERIKNEHTKEIMGVNGKPDIIYIIEQKRL